MSLKDALLALPSPVLILGNKTHDGDSLGSSIGVLSFLLEAGKTAKIGCINSIPLDIAWMLNDYEDYVADEVYISSYSSLVVLDDRVDSDRLGLELLVVPTVCVDHHHSNFTLPVGDEVVRLDWDWRGEGLNITYFWQRAPSTASVLIAKGVYHPLLFVSLYTDTVGFRVSTTWVMRDLLKLVENTGLTDEQIRGYLEAMSTLPPLISFKELLELDATLVTGTYEDKPIQLLIAKGHIDTDEAYNTIRWTLGLYADVTCLMNSRNGRGSLRSRIPTFNVSEIAGMFGGGGHVQASGFNIDPSWSSGDFSRLSRALIRKISNPQVTMIG